jgi:hypothetical protein
MYCRDDKALKAIALSNVDWDILDGLYMVLQVSCSH